MKKIENMAAQGDVLFRRVSGLPTGLTESPAAERVVVAHSETGHHHYLEVVPGVRHYVGSDPTIAFLTLEGEADVIHARPFDTHQTLRLTPGIWEVRRQREYTPEGWRRVED